METALAIGTLVVVAANCAMVWQSRRQVAATKLAVEAAHRPVIVRDDTAETTRVWHDRPLRAEPKLTYRVANVGKGPALNVRGECVVYAAEYPWGSGHVRSPVSLADGSTTALIFSADHGSLDPPNRLELRLVYEDVAGRSYWTALHVDQREQYDWCEVGEGDLPARLVLSPDHPYIGYSAGSVPTA